MKYRADVRSLIAKLQATLAGSSEGRGCTPGRTSAAVHDRHDVEEPRTSAPARPSLEPTGSTSSGSGRGTAVPGQARGCKSVILPDGGMNRGAGWESGRPLLESSCDDWHEWYTARMAAALRKQAIRTARYKRKLWREAEAAREERRRGKTYGPDGLDPFRGLRG